MFAELSYQRFTDLATSHKKIAVFKQIPGDRLTPTNTFLSLKESFHNITLLESNPKESNANQTSHLCFDPIVSIKSFGRNVIIEQNNEIKTVKQDPLQCLRDYQSQLACHVDHPDCGFIGGMVGFISYDSIRLIEDIPDRHPNQDNIPDLLFKVLSS